MLYPVASPGRPLLVHVSARAASRAAPTCSSRDPREAHSSRDRPAGSRGRAHSSR